MDTKLLATISDNDIFPNKKVPSDIDWQLRKTVKIIALNKEGQIAMVTNPIHGMYLLPGGGVEEGEELFDAATRECEEEIGYSIEGHEIIGKTKEFRARDKKEYDTYCIVASITKPITEDLRTDNEKDLNISIKWFDKNEALKILDEQDKKLKKGEVPFYNTGFNIVRDGVFIKNYTNTN